MNDQRITFQYVLWGILAVFVTWIIHEFAHWATAELLGYDSLMRLNATNYIGETPGDVHRNIVSFAGPLVTLIQGLVIFLILQRSWNKSLYPFLATAFYMRLLAGLMNFISLNDEGRISKYLGIGTFTLSIIICGILFFFIFRISRKYGLKVKFQAWTTLIIMFFSAVLVMLDQFLKIRII